MSAVSGTSTLGVVGVNHRTAPIEIRERFHVRAERLEHALRETAALEGVQECVLLSTCNRVELYVRGVSYERAVAAAERLLAQESGLSVERAREYLYRHRGRGAVEHLFRVVAGLDSMVPGEAEIQGQVREAYQRARRVAPGGVGPALHRMFQHAQSAGGRIRAETAVGEGAASVPSAAVRLARKVFGSLEGREALILGAGEMGKLTLRCLRDEGVHHSLVASRSLESARCLAAEVGGDAIGPEDLVERLGSVDIVVSCTAAPEPVLRAEQLDARPRRGGAPLVILDIAVPRDVEEAVGQLPEVFLYNIDDLQRVVESAEEARRSEIPRAEAIVSEEAEAFCSWYRAREAVPLIKELRTRGEEIREMAVEELLEDLEGLDHEQEERVREAFRLAVNRLLHAPTVELRQLAAERRGSTYLEAVRRLFRLDHGSGEAPGAGRAAGARETGTSGGERGSPSAEERPEVPPGRDRPGSHRDGSLPPGDRGDERTEKEGDPVEKEQGRG